MPLESASWITDLIEANPPGSDTVGQGDDHLRMLKRVLRNNFPDADKQFYLPKGLAQDVDITLTPADSFKMLRSNTTAADVDVTLPLAADCKDGWLCVIRKSNAPNDLNIIPSGGDAINGDTVPIVLTDDEEWALVWRINSTTWSVAVAIGRVTTGKIADDAVTNAQLADMPAATIKGRPVVGGGGNPVDLSPTDATAILNVFAATLKGLAPGPTAAEIADQKVLRADATWRFSGAPHATLRDQKAAGVAGGTFTSGAWQIRDLTNIGTNVNNFVSLSSNEFTLPAGDYRIDWEAPAFAVDGHQSRLFNVSDATILGFAGSPGYSSNGNPTQNWSSGTAQGTLAAAKTLRIEHMCQTTQATTGFGRPANFGEVETYTKVRIYRM